MEKVRCLIKSASGENGDIRDDKTSPGKSTCYCPFEHIGLTTK